MWMDTTIVALDSTTGAMQLQCKPGGKIRDAETFPSEFIQCDVWSCGILWYLLKILIFVLMMFCDL